MIATFNIKKINLNQSVEAEDQLAVEEPLEIQLSVDKQGDTAPRNLSVTMRTPGQDDELAIGFLFTEGIIQNREQVKGVSSTGQNTVLVTLAENVNPSLQKTDRNFYMTSSCGVCGKSSIDAIRTVSAYQHIQGDFGVSGTLLYSLPEQVRKQQKIFDSTGGLHATALFDGQGKLMLLREDVGRHNAMDKIIGGALMKGLLPLNHAILLLSGRASFELIQKASMAGIKLVAAIGAPSSLAVELAKEFDMTLIGFLRDKRFNIYSGSKRIIV